MTRSLHAFEHFLADHPMLDAVADAAVLTALAMVFIGTLHLFGAW